MPGSISSSGTAATSVGRRVGRMIGNVVSSLTQKPTHIPFSDYPVAAKSARRAAVGRFLLAEFFKSDPNEPRLVRHLDRAAVRESLANKLVAFVRRKETRLLCCDFEITTANKVKHRSTKLIKALTELSEMPAPLADGSLKLMLADWLADFADKRNQWVTFGSVTVTSPIPRSPTTPGMWHIWVPAGKVTAANVFGRFTLQDQHPALAQGSVREVLEPTPVKSSKRVFGGNHDQGDGQHGKRARGGSAEFDPTEIISVPVPAVPLQQQSRGSQRKRRSSDNGHTPNKRANLDDQ